MRVIARAKVNLHLDVLGRRADGYHEIETIYQSVNLFDEMDVRLTDDGRIDITCDTPGIPTDERNLCHRAVVAMRSLAGDRLGARIELHKRIPSQAGLGGGSADAAGVMLAVRRDRLGEVPLETLHDAALSVGSDVPFMLHGGTMLGRGRGEVLTPLVPVRRGVFLIVKPDVSISTARAYAGVNSPLTTHRARINLKAVTSVLARFPTVSPPFRNALEDVVCPGYPAVANALDELLSEGPALALMAGSGSAMFAVFGEQARAERLAKRFSVRGFFTSVVEPAKRAVDIE